MQPTTVLIAALLVCGGASAQEAMTAKALFFGTDGATTGIATALPQVPRAPQAPHAVPAAPAVATKSSTRTAAVAKPAKQGAAYFIRLRNDDGSVKDVLTTHAFRSKQRFQLGVKVQSPSYVYIYNKEANGQVVQLYPQPGKSNFVDAMGVVFLPAEGSFEFDDKPGVEQLSIYLARRPMGNLASTIQGLKPDLVSDPARVVVAAGGECTAPSDTAQEQAIRMALADPGSTLLASKGIRFREADACAAGPVLASKGIVFANDPAPAAGGQVSTYVVKADARPNDALHLQINLLHR